MSEAGLAAASWARHRAAAMALVLSALASTAPGQNNPSAPPAPAAAETLAADLREAVHRLPVTVADLYGRRETRELVLTVFKPPGTGPHPLLVFNHGRSGTNRALPPRHRFETQARYFVSKGFAVVVPTRVGYGEASADFDPEESGPCNNKRYAPMGA
jgi:dipeptidyl aminopeptidase/acylaminoacyl peptidase